MNSPNRIKIYPAYALTNAPVQFRSDTERLRTLIAANRPEWEILGFYGLGASPSDGLVARTDITQVLRANLVCAISDVDSTGMGEEAGIRLALGLPILFLARTDWKRTRMVSGLPELWPDYVMFQRYERMEDCEHLIAHAIKKLGITPGYAPELRVAPHLKEIYEKEVIVGQPSKPGFGKPGFVQDSTTKDPVFVVGQH